MSQAQQAHGETRQVNYDQRMALVKEWIKSEMLTRFTPPSGIDTKTALSDVAETVNASLPDSKHFEYYLENLTKFIVRQSRTRTLPPARDFQIACENVAKSLSVSHSAPTQQADTSTYLRVTVARVRSGQAISDFWLKHHAMEELLTKTDLTLVELQPYIDAHARQQRSTEGEY